ncbi:MAG: transglutaminase domain-containing protein [Brevundimonas sp.]
MPELETYAVHSPFSDPGPYRSRVAAVPPDPNAISTAAVAVIAHYRGEAAQLTDEQVGDVKARWLPAILDLAADRAPLDDLGEPRPYPHKAGGCCRDHTLFGVSVLREHGVPARSRIGFESYFEPGWHHDHVVVEWWDGARWTRFDPEVHWEVGFDPRDMPTGNGSAFETAAEVWLAHRRDGRDLATYGVDRSLPHLTGPGFAVGQVFLELAHRERDEVLLWDVWGAGASGLPDPMRPPGAPTMAPDEAEALADEIAALLVAADDDPDADAELDRRYASDPRLNLSAGVVTLSPDGSIGDVDLTSRAVAWR